MWVRDLTRGAAFGFGFALARVFWLPVLMLLVALTGRGFVWAQSQHVTLLAGLAHVALVAKAALVHGLHRINRMPAGG